MSCVMTSQPVHGWTTRLPLQAQETDAKEPPRRLRSVSICEAILKETDGAFRKTEGTGENIVASTGSLENIEITEPAATNDADIIENIQLPVDVPTLAKSDPVLKPITTQTDCSKRGCSFLNCPDHCAKWGLFGDSFTSAWFKAAMRSYFIMNTFRRYKLDIFLSLSKGFQNDFKVAPMSKREGTVYVATERTVYIVRKQGDGPSKVYAVPELSSVCWWAWGRIGISPQFHRLLNPHPHDILFGRVAGIRLEIIDTDPDGPLTYYDYNPHNFQLGALNRNRLSPATPRPIIEIPGSVAIDADPPTLSSTNLFDDDDESDGDTALQEFLYPDAGKLVKKTRLPPPKLTVTDYGFTAGDPTDYFENYAPWVNQRGSNHGEYLFCFRGNYKMKSRAHPEEYTFITRENRMAICAYKAARRAMERAEDYRQSYAEICGHKGKPEAQLQFCLEQMEPIVREHLNGINWNVHQGRANDIDAAVTFVQWLWNHYIVKEDNWSVPPTEEITGFIEASNVAFRNISYHRAELFVAEAHLTWAISCTTGDEAVLVAKKKVTGHFYWHVKYKLEMKVAQLQNQRKVGCEKWAEKAALDFVIFAELGHVSRARAAADAFAVYWPMCYPEHQMNAVQILKDLSCFGKMLVARRYKGSCLEELQGPLCDKEYRIAVQGLYFVAQLAADAGIERARGAPVEDAMELSQLHAMDGKTCSLKEERSKARAMFLKAEYYGRIHIQMNEAEMSGQEIELYENPEDLATALMKSMDD